jgi:hypothetical protein
MGEQLFRLNGEPWDLQELAYCFQEGSATVQKVEDFFYSQARNGFRENG